MPTIIDIDKFKEQIPDYDPNKSAEFQSQAGKMADGEYDSAYKIGLKKIESSINNDPASQKLLERKLKESNIQSAALKQAIQRQNRLNIFNPILNYFKNL